MPRAVFVALALLSCSKRASDVQDSDVPDSDTDTSDTDVPPGGLTDWIGSPCATDADCPYDGGTCFHPDDGYPQGMCTLGCDQTCPDADGHPVTFCVDDTELPAAAPSVGDGACHSRCDFGYYPETGCRTGYGCARVPRANDAGTELYACLPGEGDVLPDCYHDLAAAGVRFEPTVVPDRSPNDLPELTCHVEAPIIIRPPMHDMEIVNSAGTQTGLTGACSLGLSLSDTVLDAKDRGATRMFHLGTYVCRTIAGTTTLSRHAYGDAIDIAGFELADGTVYTLLDDWEHDTTTPSTPGGAWLYDAAYDWYDARYWNIILTPNYNAAHDNHFHVDLTPGSDFIGFTDGRYIGPAPYAD
ncbi:MAG: extensin family protein [Alphaproteobacteria bacterium]|nr:extensin family protein [Alphaproteobacteria bacterium]